MFFRSATEIICTTLLIMEIFTTGCNAGRDRDRERHIGHTKNEYVQVECYECNSAYDPRCGEKFDNFTIGVVDCTKRRPPDHILVNATFCRKTVQKVQGITRVIRGCGYFEDAKEFKSACIKRTGTHDVHITYCACRGKLCNTGNTQNPTFSIVIGMLLAALILIPGA